MQEASGGGLSGEIQRVEGCCNIKVPALSESYYIKSFLCGLEEEIKHTVKMHKPAIVQATFEMTWWQAHNLQFVENQCKVFFKNA